MPGPATYPSYTITDLSGQQRYELVKLILCTSLKLVYSVPVTIRAESTRDRRRQVERFCAVPWMDDPVGRTIHSAMVGVDLVRVFRPNDSCCQTVPLSYS